MTYIFIKGKVAVKFVDLEGMNFCTSLNIFVE